MRRTTSIPSALLGMAMTFALASAAQATATRTYVSSAGVDSNTASNCPHTAPCKTFAAAYSVTLSGGEIVALDLSTYGPLTITGPVTITAMEGAIITVQSSTTGITVSAAATDVVILRNLQISGAAGSSNTQGIVVNSGRLHLYNSTLSRLNTGLNVTSSNNAKVRAFLTNTDIVGNAYGVSTNGTGVDVQVGQPTGNIEVFIFGGGVMGNTVAGFYMFNPGQNQNQNPLYTVFLASIANGINVNLQGNGTLAFGVGTGCVIAGSCTSVWTYTPQSGFQVPTP